MATTRAREPASRSLADGPPMAVRKLQFWITNYRRTWRGSIYTGVLSPVLFLGAMGLGLGTLVDKHGTAGIGGVSYLVYIAPGLMVSEAMQTAMGESSYPVFGAVKWLKTYQAAIASPLRPADLFHGHLLFTTLRLTMNAVVFLVVMTAYGAMVSPWVLACLPAAVLTGLAFAAPIEAFAMTCAKDSTFALLLRFGIIPMFLFSGVFFPVPAVLLPVAYATPLWHGVELCRSLALGTARPGAVALHAGYLIAVTALGVLWGNRTYRRRLYA
jgi:lipooligosaccharide transport system permease protein